MRKLITAALALGALVLACAGTASAQPAAAPVVNHQAVQEAGGLGVTLPSSVVETPDGSIWVSDELYGVCRVTASGLVESAFGAPEPLEPADGTPLAVVEDPTRPTVARQIAFDAVTGNFYAAEGSSAGSGVWRMHWDAATGRDRTATKIYDSTAADDRVFGLTLTETGDVVFSSKRTDNIRRGDGPVSYTCALDGLDAMPCSPPKDYAGLAMGDHTITVVGTDAAGNASALATWSVTAVPTPPKPKPVTGPNNGDPPATPLVAADAWPGHRAGHARRAAPRDRRAVRRGVRHTGRRPDASLRPQGRRALPRARPGPATRSSPCAARAPTAGARASSRRSPTRGSSVPARRMSSTLR